MKRRVALFALALALVAVLSIGTPQPTTAANSCPAGIAHRGNAHYGGPPESSIDAFEASFSGGSDWVESDLQFTRDVVPVLMHDPTVDRMTTGSGPISGMTAAQFTALTMDDGQHPPTLRQALDLVRGDPKRHLLVEVKKLTAAQQQALLTTLRGMESRVVVNAFADHLPTLQSLKAANPLLSVSLLTYEPVLPSPAGISGQDLEYRHVTAAHVAELHAQGVVVRAWTPNDAARWQSMRTAGVDAILTNKSDAYQQWLKAQCPPPPVTSMGEPAPTVRLHPDPDRDSAAGGAGPG